MPLFIAFLSGLLMSLGMAYSKMIDPNKVLGFLTLNEHWDPSLILVMASALSVYALGYWLIIGKKKPIAADSFSAPLQTQIDKRLLLGSLIFGLGWGIVGYCPGPAIAAISSLNLGTLAFVASMILGWFINKTLISKSLTK